MGFDTFDAAMREQLGQYFDYNATTPYHPVARSAVDLAMSVAWGNPSSTGHKFGSKSKDMLEKARGQIGKAIGAPSPNDIVILSGGTEANNLVLENAVRLFEARQRVNHEKSTAEKPHIIISAIEHPAIVNPAKDLESRGLIELTVLALRESHGAVHPEDVVAALKPNTTVVSVMLTNNETGCCAPIREIVDAIRGWEAAQSKRNEAFSRRIMIHTDAAQALGKATVNVEELGVDMLTIVGHKFYAPRIGALYVRNLHERWSKGFDMATELKQEVPLFPVIFGGGQEKGFRSGTENVPQVAGLGAAAEFVTENITFISSKNKELIEIFESLIKEKAIPSFGIAVHGEQSPWGRIGNVCMFSVVRYTEDGVVDASWNMDNATLASKLVERGFIVGKGAACHSDGTTSGVLAAMKVEPAVAKTALRLSVGLWSTKEDIEKFVETFWQIVVAA